MDEYYAFVFCPGRGSYMEGCGRRGLTEAEYMRQLDKPDQKWRCPDCQADALFDDAAFDRMHYQVEEA